MLACDVKSPRIAGLIRQSRIRSTLPRTQLLTHRVRVSQCVSLWTSVKKSTGLLLRRSYAGARTELSQGDGPSALQGSDSNAGESTVTGPQSPEAAADLSQNGQNGQVNNANVTANAAAILQATASELPASPAAGQIDENNKLDQKKAKAKYQLLKRVSVGLALGLFGALIVLTGQKMYLCTVSFIVYLATTEYFGFLTSKGISKGMTPPPRVVSVATMVLCISITLATFLLKGQYHGTTLSVAAVALLACNVIALKRPTFSMLVTSLFGLIYCGYLPSFWVRLRFVSSPLEYGDAVIPALISNWFSWTLGLAVTFTAGCCVAFADVGAYFVGKNFGKTQLTEISPKKTVEGAIGGLLSSVAVAVILGQLFRWPAEPWVSVVFGVLVFFSSLCGDLVESIMKREAEMKDSGSLLPGHGGLLDRFDSYMFTGAVVYVFSIVLLPRLGLA